MLEEGLWLYAKAIHSAALQPGIEKENCARREQVLSAR